MKADDYKLIAGSLFVVHWGFLVVFATKSLEGTSWVWWIISASFFGALIFWFISKERQEKEKEEEEQIRKIETARTGEPITLKSYGVINPDGTDTGKRFIRKKDAEDYLKRLNQR